MLIQKTTPRQTTDILYLRSYVSLLACECLEVPLMELAEVAGEKSVWAPLLKPLPP